MKRITSPTLLAIRDLLPGYVGLFFLSSFITLLFIVGPLYSMQVGERVFTSRNMNTLLVLTIIASFLLIMGAVIEHIRTKALQRLGIAIDARLSKSFFAGLYRQADKPAQAELALQDLNRVRDTLSGQLVGAFCDTAWTPLLIIVMCMMHWTFGLLGLCMILLSMALSFTNQYLVKQDSKRHIEASVAANAFGAALSRNADVARSMGMLPTLQTRWGNLHSSMLGWRYLATRRADIIRSLSSFLHRYQFITIYLLGALLFLEDLIPASVLMLAVMLILRGLQPIESFINNWHQIPAFFAARERLDEILKVGDEMAKVTLPRPSGELEVKRLVGTAPGSDKLILHDVSFNVVPGRALAVVGPSGAGKSCLTRFLVNAWVPKRGGIQIGDYEYSHWDQDQLGRLVGYVPQEVEFLPGTVAENISRFYPDEGNQSDLLIAAVELAGVQDLIRSLPDGFNTKIGPGGYVLSGGQRQRLAVARAVFGNPYLIVMDEPNANLDSQGEQALGATIQQLRANNRLVVLVTHRMSLLTYCDDVLVLNAGAVQAFGERDQILNRLPRLKAPPNLALVGNASGSRE